ncbi:MAG: GNAT family N-acetyltransferase [Bacteroidales bacterium]|nr:GNAT family N-acetyltransferase [Bacteroidales bacterium]
MPSNPQSYNFTPLLSAIGESGDKDNLSLNPCLPFITGKAMGWPVTALLFEVNETPVAWFAALHNGKEWFSLPHYNNGAFWFDETRFNTLTGNDQQAHTDKRAFFEQFILNGAWFTSGPAEDQFIIINLDRDNLSSSLPLHKANERITQRSFSVLAENKLSHKVDSSLKLKSTGQDQFSVFTAGVRRKINKAVKNGISLQTGGIELLSDFYPVYRRKIHELGSFGLPESFFSLLLKEYTHGTIKVLIARHHGKVIGCALLMTSGRYAENPWFATLEKHNHLYVSYLLHWEMIKTAIEAGCHTYSFGYSTRNSGVHHYKQQWGTNDKTIFLNSTLPVSDKLSKKQYLRSIIRHLPQRLMQQLDTFIAQHYY